jgi:phosphoadenosine phosphosulfate reductase
MLQEARARTPSCLVFYSGGKDSLAMMDILVRVFDRVDGVFMYFVPGLECIEEKLEYARQRWGVTIHQYPHWCLSRILLAGVYRLVGMRQVFGGVFNEYLPDGSSGKLRVNSEGIPELSLNDIYEMVKLDTGIGLIATGAKRADSLWRRKMLGNWGNRPDIIYPLKNWNKPDVYAYLMARQIPIPDGTQGSSTGIDLTQKSLLWLHDEHPRDFDKICEIFPLAEAVVWHRKFYGDTSTTGTEIFG